MLLNALTTGRPSCCETHALSGVPDSVAFRIVVSGVHHNGAVGVREEVPGQIGNLVLRDRDNHQVLVARRVPCRDGVRAGFCREVGQRLGSSRVGYGHVVSQRGEAAGERATNVPGANDADIHARPLLVRRK